MTGRIWIPYCGAAPPPAEWLARWNFDPLLLAALAGAGLGWAAWRARGGGGRDAAFAGGLLALFLLFVSPLCALTSALFTARAAHHVLLTAVAAPLLVAALPRAVIARLPGPLAFWTAAHALIFWSWHAPDLYAWALSSDALYWLMQASLLASALGLWAAVRRAPPPAAAAALLATMVQMGLLGALLTVASAGFYAPHFATTTAWGYSPLEDQQLAGLVMWAPAAGLYLGAALLLVGRWLGDEARVPARR